MNAIARECKNKFHVSQNVLAETASACALEVEGVQCGKNDVFVRYTGGAAELDILLKLKSGIRAEVCAKAVQNAVKNGIQAMTGITVSRVNIKITGQI